MRKTLLLALLAATAISQAQVNTIPVGPFVTATQLMENFDTIPSGSYFGASLFQPPMAGTVYALNPPNMVDIMPPPGWQPPAFSPPNTCIGTGTDLGIRVSPVMRRFGGYFRNAPNIFGIAPTAAKIVFYDQSNNFIGAVGVPLTNTWTWRGWWTNPRFSRIEIYGGAGPGGVELDNIEVRPV